MEKGVCKTWAPEQEELWARRLKGCRSFAERYLVMSVRDLLKYDGRTKQAKRAIAQCRLRLATATDQDLEEIAKLESEMLPRQSVAEILEELKKTRTEIKGKGIKGSELMPVEARFL